MQRDSFRRALRAETAPDHAQLDQQFGALSSRALYSSFMQKTYAFRAAMEGAVAPASADEWQPEQATPVLARDLEDLGVALPAPVQTSLSLASPWARMGAHYVVEGSSLGARLLVRQAQALNFTPEFGARYLSRSAANTTRWDGFVAALEATPVTVRGEIVEAARSSFRFALSVYAGEFAS